ncbi:Competence protein ComEC [Frankia canadensis]|uniref:Competence protein ComEC n=1 Tax=Frankia canadensis TaxID=1836972 RepID=A0A2I2KML1_9ACTN|nr:ComEC/Rec2 family competence protein [Frankia canadensis]SNQ46893.1 Competence protein ComEC [Frankia canadensis]SOU54183.1 Competence protein ComEC [Frankia canadensis]
MDSGPARRPGPPPEPVDARLVLPAVAAWAGAAVAVRWTMPGILLTLAAVPVIAVPALLAGWYRRGVPGRRGSARARPRRGPRQADQRPSGRNPGDEPPRLVTLGAVVVVFLAAGVIAGGLGTRPGDRGPFADLVRREAAATAQVVVTDDPRQGTGQGQLAPDRARATYVTPARLERVTAAGVTLRVRAAVVLIGRGSAWQELLPSQHLAVTGRLAAPRSDPGVAAVLLVSGDPQPRGRPSPVQRAAGRLRAGLREAAAGLPQPRRGLLPAIVDGDVSGLDAGVRADFRAAGMSHLTAVSGGNAAIVTASVLFAAAWARRGRRMRAALGGGALISFVVLARPSPSVLRAGVMGLIGLAAYAAGRPRAVLPALAASVTLLVLVQPTLAVSVGFALSVQATAGMIVLAPGWRVALARRLPERIADVLAVAAAAQLACTPQLAWIGGGVSVVAIPANVLAAPAVPVATVLGVLVLCVGVVAPVPARWLAHLADLPCWWLVTVAHRCAALPRATLGWPGGAEGAAGAAVAVAVALALLRRRRGRRLAAAALAGLLLARCAVVERFAAWPPADWRLVACDVGQGDALVLRAGPGSAVLVDAGPDPGLLARCLTELGIRSLPLILLSHLHADHVNGLPAVLGRLPVGEVVVGQLREPAGQWRLVRRWAQQARVPLRTIEAGTAGAAGAVCWTALGPRVVLHGTDSDPNNDSLVVSARVGALRVLLTGDVEAVAQRSLRDLPGEATLLRADVLKVPHHGSANQDPAFLAASGARFALVSVGRGNDYGHPAPPTLRTLARAGMAVARTDRDGALAVTAPAMPARTGAAVGGGGACPSPRADPGVALPGDVSVVRRRAGDGS